MDILDIMCASTAATAQTVSIAVFAKCGETPAMTTLDRNFGSVDPTSCKSRNGALHRCKIFRLGSPIRHPSYMGPIADKDSVQGHPRAISF